MRGFIALAMASAAGLLPAARAVADVTDECIAAAEQSQVDRRDGHLQAAHNKLLSCSRDACPAAIQKDCKGWLAEVEPRIPTIVVRAVDQNGNDVTAVRVLVDGGMVATSLDGKALSLDPGDHDFRFEAGTRVVSQRIQIREGERDRLLSVKLPAEGGAEQHKVPVGAWVIGGIGLASLTVGAALWGRGRIERSDLYDTCGKTQSCTESAVNHAKNELVAGDIAASVGIVAIGGAIIWGAVGASASGPTVDAHPVVGGAVVTVSGSF